MSTTESEVQATVILGKKLLFIINLLSDLHIDTKLPVPVQLDNQACIRLLNSENSISEHVIIMFVYGSSKISLMLKVFLVYTASSDMISDGFTKPLDKTAFNTLRDRICIGDAVTLLEGLYI